MISCGINMCEFYGNAYDNKLPNEYENYTFEFTAT